MRPRPARLGGRVPLLRRQLASERLQVAVTVLIVGLAVALVLLLTGLRRGMSVQVTRYIDHQPALFLGQAGATNFLGQVSVLDDGVVERVRAIPGVQSAWPITHQFAMLTVHGRRVPAQIVGSDPAGAGGPWKLAAGRLPTRAGEVVIDEALASDHDFKIGDDLAFRAARLRVVGLSADSSAFMLPLTFTTRETANELARRPGTASFVLVRPDPDVDVGALARRIERAVPGADVLRREQLRANDRSLLTGAFNGPIMAMIIVALAVGLLVIATSTYAAVSARAREFTTLRALGMRSSRLAALALGHGLTLAVLGVLVGAVGSRIAAWSVHEVAPKYLITIQPTTSIAVAVVTVLVGALASVWPARVLSSLDPAGAFAR